MAKKVLRKIQPRVGEEARFPHRAARDHAAGAFLADYLAEVPDHVPEVCRIADRPGVQRIIAVETLAGAPAGFFRENGDREAGK